ncbi:MAG TPA: ATP-binding protein [Opitutaceae bacterium]|jgi:ATP-dependent DNA helicase RecG|nr:ATP-binding protein [Opitutaceae bacterium]
MSIEVVEVGKEQISLITSRQESHFLDFKAIEITPGNLTRTVSAFSNSSGGELYIGIDQTDVMGDTVFMWRGFANPEDANGHIQIFEKLFPLGQYYNYTFLKSTSAPGLVLHVEVRKSRQIAYASDRIAYLRRGAQNLPQKSEEELRRLRLDKGVVSFESETVAAPAKVLIEAIPLLEFLKTVVPTAKPKDWLLKQLMVVGGKPTVAGVLLFSGEPQAVIPKHCGVKIYRYKTTEAVGTRETLAFDPITIEGHLYAQIKSAVEKTIALVEDMKKLGTTGFERIEYPHEALHEILTNALLHRDYSVASDVHIRIFDNRIEVESPGKLPGHVTVRNILSEQLARNGAIVRMINKFPDAPNKDVGEGLNTAFTAMNKLKLKPPVIEERESSVVVHILHEPLASPEETVIAYLDTHPQIYNKVGREITGITSENTMKKVFYKLRDSGLIEAVLRPSGAAYAWRKVKK